MAITANWCGWRCSCSGTCPRPRTSSRVYASLHTRRSRVEAPLPYVRAADGAVRSSLHASAGRVREDRLRPLPVLEPDSGHQSGPRQAWRGWLVPAAAAVSVTLIIVLAVALTGHPGHPAAS